MRKLALAFVVCISATVICSGQSSESLLRELLDLPSPPARHRDAAGDESKGRPAAFYDPNNVPPDDAPLKDLLDYWEAVSSRGPFAGGATMNEASAARILDRAATEPLILDSYLGVLPKTEDIGKTVERIYAASASREEIGDSWKSSVKQWLTFNTHTFINELEAAARAAKDHSSYGSVINSEELAALARLDWDRAKPILQKHAKDESNKRTAARALVLLYEHAVAKNDPDQGVLRDELKKIAQNKDAPARARDFAMEALAATPWPGQDEWYASLFEDESLLTARDGNTLYTPICELAEKKPDQWTPILTRMLESKSKAVRNSAVSCLIGIETEDSIRPLIPWLSDPEWAQLDWSPGGRTTLMQIVSKFELREAIPGLIWIVDNEPDNLRWAARELGEFKDPQAIPSLRRALFETTKTEDDRNVVITALLQVNGLSAAEQTNALEEFAAASLIPEAIAKINERSSYEDVDPLPPAISIGKYLTNIQDPSDEFALAVIERQRQLAREKPELAKRLSEFIARWKSKVVDAALIAMVEAGVADANTIVGLLARRKELHADQPNLIYDLRTKPGLPGAIAACITENESDLFSAFHGDDRATRIGALACSRLLRLHLPVRETATLLRSKDKLLALAAERYLESVDTVESRRLVYAVHPNDALILGARRSFDPARRFSHGDYASLLERLFASVSRVFSFEDKFTELDKAEKKLRDEIKTDPNLLQIYALLPNHESGQRIVRIYKTRATYTTEIDAARYKEKQISKQELEAFTRTMSEVDVDSFVPGFVSCHHDCWIREFVSISKNGGRRIFNGSGFGAMGILDSFGDVFDSTAMVTRYRLERHVFGLKVLYSTDSLTPTFLWKNGNDFRVLIGDNKKEEQIRDELRKSGEADDKNEELDYDAKRAKQWQRSTERMNEHFEWRRFDGAKFTGAVGEPDQLPFLALRSAFPQLEDLHENHNAWQAVWKDYQIRKGRQDGGLWLTSKTSKRKLADGVFYSEVVVGGDWVVAARNDSNGDDPKHLVRIDLLTGRELKIDLPPARANSPVAFVPAHNKILIHHSDYEYSTLNPQPATYYLLDPASGKLEKVTGQFHPLFTQDVRPLQPTGKPDEFWATVYSRARHETEIGIYNTRSFTFRTVLRLPEILISSDEVWVDADESKAYFIYSDEFRRHADLVSVELPSIPK